MLLDKTAHARLGTKSLETQNVSSKRNFASSFDFRPANSQKSFWDKIFDEWFIPLCVLVSIILLIRGVWRDFQLRAFKKEIKNLSRTLERREGMSLLGKIKSFLGRGKKRSR